MKTPKKNKPTKAKEKSKPSQKKNPKPFRLTENKSVNKPVKSKSASQNKGVTGARKSIQNDFPDQAICEMCRNANATRFAEFLDQDSGRELHRFVCGTCSTNARRPAIEIQKFFSSPRTTVAMIDQMLENGTDWKSFGEMMQKFCRVTNSHGVLTT